MSNNIKQPTVAEKWANALEVMEDGKVSKKVQTLIEAIYAPKSASQVNPPKLDSDGNILEVFDRWFDVYVSADEAVMSNGKPKGYSKASISLWNKYFSKSKELMADLWESGMTLDDAKLEIIAAKKSMNDPKSFDYSRDTQRFIDKTKMEVSWNVDTQSWDIEDIEEDD